MSLTIEIIKWFTLTHIEIKLKEQEEVNNISNIFECIEKHQKNEAFFNESLEKDIEYFSSHFYELEKQVLAKIKKGEFYINDEVFENIINNDKLVLSTEDDLI